MAYSYNKLWKLMIDKGIKKTQLCNAAGISTNAMAKLGRNEDIRGGGSCEDLHSLKLHYRRHCGAYPAKDRGS